MGTDVEKEQQGINHIVKDTLERSAYLDWEKEPKWSVHSFILLCDIPLIVALPGLKISCALTCSPPATEQVFVLIYILVEYECWYALTRVYKNVVAYTLWFFLLYILYFFRTFSMIALHSFLSFLALINVCFLTIYPTFCSTINFTSLLGRFSRCLPLMLMSSKWPVSVIYSKSSFLIMCQKSSFIALELTFLCF